MVVTTSGHVFSWGTNLQGALGLGPGNFVADSPKLVKNLPPTLFLTSYYDHTLYFTEDKQIFGVGSCSKG